VEELEHPVLVGEVDPDAVVADVEGRLAVAELSSRAPIQMAGSLRSP